MRDKYFSKFISLFCLRFLGTVSLFRSREAVATTQLYYINSRTRYMRLIDIKRFKVDTYALCLRHAQRTHTHISYYEEHLPQSEPNNGTQCVSVRKKIMLQIKTESKIRAKAMAKLCFKIFLTSPTLPLPLSPSLPLGVFGSFSACFVFRTKCLYRMYMCVRRNLFSHFHATS